MRRLVLALLFALTGCSGDDSREAAPAAEAPEAPTPPAPDMSVFVMIPGADPMTDQSRNMITTGAVGSDGPGGPLLVWRCEGSDVDLIILADEFLNSSDPVEVQWRLDDAPASPPEEWGVSTRGTGVFAPDETLLALTEGVPGAGRLRVRLVDYNETPHDLEFRLGGFGDAYARLGCGLEGATARLAARLVAREAGERERRARAQASDRAERERVAAEIRRLDSIQAREDSLASLAIKARQRTQAFPLVGNPETKRYYTTTKECWRRYADSARAVFFRSQADATSQGYGAAGVCQP